METAIELSYLLGFIGGMGVAFLIDIFTECLVNKHFKS